MKFLRPGEREIPVRLLGADIGEYSIVTYFGERMGLGTPGTPLNEARAARELQKYIALVTGFSLPIIGDVHSYTRAREIVIGHTARKAAGLSDIEDDGFHIKTDGTRLFINGGKRGVLYGVYSFLEEYLGLRFFAPDAERIADAANIEIGEIDRAYSPPFEYRELCFWNAWDSEFSVKNKINGGFIRQIGEEWGGCVKYAGGFAGFVHTFSSLVPPKKYFKAHPEYYALDEKGVREPEGLCLTDEGTYEAALKTALKWAAGAPDGILSVSINDGCPYCCCPACNAVKEEEGAGESGPVMRFVNRIAEALEKKYPKLAVDTIVYDRVKRVPRLTKPRGNVVIRFCGSTYRSHSLNDDIPAAGAQEYNVQFGAALNARHSELRANLDEWAKACGRIYVWDYPAPYLYINSVFPHFHTILDTVKYYKSKNAKGFFLNGNTATAQFSEMTVYLLAKALWNPDMSADEYYRHMDEFLCGNYGGGWRHIRAFIDDTREMAKGRAFHSTCKPEDILPPSEELYKKLKGYFDRAAKEAESAADKRRIERVAVQAEFYRLVTGFDKAYKEGNEKEREQLVKDNRKLYETMTKHGILRVHERYPLGVITDFRQSPEVWGYWDFAAVCADRNNDNYSRDIYGLIASDLPLGAKADISFLLAANNTNADCFADVYSNKGRVYLNDGKGARVPLVWEDFKEHKRVSFPGVSVTDIAEYAKFENKPLSRRRYEFIAGHKRGFMFRMENIAPGGYFMIRDVIVTKK